MCVFSSNAEKEYIRNLIIEKLWLELQKKVKIKDFKRRPIVKKNLFNLLLIFILKRLGKQSTKR